VRDLLRGYADAGIDEVILVAQAGHNRHEDICQSLQMFGEEILPEFAATEPEREAAKLERLGEAMAAALERREPAREIDPVAYPAAALP
jgi:hypothetical protein